jgi:hypothetical protein
LPYPASIKHQHQTNLNFAGSPWLLTRHGVKTTNEAGKLAFLIAKFGGSRSDAGSKQESDAENLHYGEPKKECLREFHA